MSDGVIEMQLLVTAPDYEAAPSQQDRAHRPGVA